MLVVCWDLLATSLRVRVAIRACRVSAEAVSASRLLASYRAKAPKPGLVCNQYMRCCTPICPETLTLWGCLGSRRVRRVPGRVHRLVGCRSSSFRARAASFVRHRGSGRPGGGCFARSACEK